MNYDLELFFMLISVILITKNKIKINSLIILKIFLFCLKIIKYGRMC
jgi:hypothetical protein